MSDYVKYKEKTNYITATSQVIIDQRILQNGNSQKAIIRNLFT